MKLVGRLGVHRAKDSPADCCAVIGGGADGGVVMVVVAVAISMHLLSHTTSNTARMYMGWGGRTWVDR